MAKLDVMRAYTALEESGDFRVTALKTDAVFYYKLKSNAELPPAIQALIGEEIGGMRLERKHPGCSPIKYVEMEEANMPTLQSANGNQTITNNNEYNPEEIKAKIKSRTILLCPPGCGNSHAALSIYALPTFGVVQVLVVTPYNAQARNIRREYKQRSNEQVKAITYHRWAGKLMEHRVNSI